jgi:hypothetical protein
MIRAIVILFATLGAVILFAAFVPSTTHTAFVVADFGVKWIYMIGAAVGFASYKITK